MQEKEVVGTSNAALASVPISQAIKAGGMIYVSGLLPIDPKTGKLSDGDFESQMELVLRNMESILNVAGSSLVKVVKTTVFLTDKRDFTKMNEVFARHFPKDPPARSAIEVQLMVDARLEIDAIALAS